MVPTMVPQAAFPAVVQRGQHSTTPVRPPSCGPQVQRDFEELPAGTALSLRDSLVTLLVKHCQVRGWALSRRAAQCAGWPSLATSCGAPPSCLLMLGRCLLAWLPRCQITYQAGEPPAPTVPPLLASPACQGNSAVRTQLCLAIAALAAHLPAVQWGPEGVVGWLAQRLGSEPQAVSLPCMLELLTVLPQVRLEPGGLRVGTKGWLLGRGLVSPVVEGGVMQEEIELNELQQHATGILACAEGSWLPPLPRRRRPAATSRRCARSGGGRCRTRCWHTRRRHATLAWLWLIFPCCFPTLLVHTCCVPYLPPSSGMAASSCCRAWRPASADSLPTARPPPRYPPHRRCKSWRRAWRRRCRGRGSKRWTPSPPGSS